MTRRSPVVAIDGPAGSGKSTVARQVAQRLGFTLVDTGAIYRCVALAAQRGGVSEDDGASLGELAEGLQIRFERGGLGKQVWLADEDVSEAIRTPEVSQGASRVSAHPQVRAALLDAQRKLGRDGGVVLEGRDIGTVVFPDAEVKVFLGASAEVRAQRRFDELARKDSSVTLEDTLAQVIERDGRDENRSVAPLKPAPDAIRIDTGPLTLAAVVDRVVALVEQQGSGAELE